MKPLLGRPHLALALAVLLGLALHAHSLSWGFIADDHAIVATLEGEVELGDMRRASLYDFGELPAPGSTSYRELGPPWWADADWKVRFFRPLASLALALDHTLWGSNAVGWHVDGLLLYALLLFACHGLYRALGLSRGVALGALLLFTCDDGSYMPVGWIANRNTLLEALFVVLALWALAAHERLGRGPAAGLALLAGLGAVGAKESGVAVAALIPAYLLFVPVPGSARRWRIATAGLAVGLGGLYLGWLLGAGYGTHSLFYPTPWGAPAEWLERLALLLPSSALALTAPVSLDLLTVLPRATPLFVGLGALIAVFLGRALWHELQRERSTRFLAAWVLLTLLPRAGAPASDRLLFVSNIAAAALFAQLIARAPRPLLANLRRSRAARWAAYLVLVTGVLSGLSLWPNSIVMLQVSEEGRSVARDTEVPPQELGERDVIFLQQPNGMAGLQPFTTRLLTSADTDLAFWSLQYGRRGLRLERTGPRTLLVTSLGTPLATSPFELLWRTTPGPLTDADGTGRRYRCGPFDAVVIRPEGDGARVVQLEFRRDLDDSRLQLTTWIDGRMQRVRPPATGQAVELEPIVPPLPLWP